MSSMLTDPIHCRCFQDNIEHMLSAYTFKDCMPMTYVAVLSLILSASGCHVFVSDSGEQALLVTNQLHLHLWELRDGLYSEWWQLPVPDDIGLPCTGTRETAIDASFYVHQVECFFMYK